jgi:hypothetical protein
MTAEERRKASGPLIGPRPRLRIAARQPLVRRSALRLPLWGAKRPPPVRSRQAFLASVKEDPDASRIAAMQFRVVIAGLAVVTREREPFSAPAIAGEGDHWSSRSERTVVEGARDSELRCRCKGMTAMKLLRSSVGKNRANLKSAYDVDSCAALRSAPPPPPCFAGWSPSPAVAVADEVGVLSLFLFRLLLRKNGVPVFLVGGADRFLAFASAVA